MSFHVLEKDAGCTGMRHRWANTVKVLQADLLIFQGFWPFFQALLSKNALIGITWKYFFRVRQSHIFNVTLLSDTNQPPYCFQQLQAKPQRTATNFKWLNRWLQIRCSAELQLCFVLLIMFPAHCVFALLFTTNSFAAPHYSKTLRFQEMLNQLMLNADTACCNPLNKWWRVGRVLDEALILLARCSADLNLKVRTFS